MKEYYVLYTLLPQYNKECTDLYFYFPCIYLGEIKFKNYYISNNARMHGIASAIAGSLRTSTAPTGSRTLPPPTIQPGRPV